ncbi:metalloprotease, partial [Linderina macrospora]
RFCVGTVETLKGEAERRGVDLRDELIKFYEQCYSSDIMRLVVYGNHSLDQLTEWAVSKFSAVPSKGDTRVKLPGHLLTKSELGRMIRIQSLDKVYVIRLVFPFEDMHPWFKEKPVSYVRSLLAHTGVGSLAHYLKKRGWSHAIEADNMSEVRFCDNIMGIIVSATKEGMAHWQDVVRAVFAYIQVLKKEGPQQWFYDEISTSRATKFRFRQAQSAISLVTSLSEHMHDMYVPPSNATSTIAQLREFNAPLISHYLDMLNPDNMCIFFLQQDFDMELTETEPHMDVKYRVDAIGQEFLSELRGELLYEGLHLPDRNPFISENLDMEKPA